MRSLSAVQKNERLTLVKSLFQKRTALETAIEQFNVAMEAASAKVEQAVEAVNSAITDADSWREGVAAEMEDYASQRSERWQESEAGQNYLAWKEQFEVAFLAVEMTMPDPLEMPDADDVAELLEQLPDTPG